MDETILIVGASGKFAGLVVPKLARRGANIRAMIHYSDDEPFVREAGAQHVVVGDLTDPASVAAALRGVDRVFYIAPVTFPTKLLWAKHLSRRQSRLGFGACVLFRHSSGAERPSQPCAQGAG